MTRGSAAPTRVMYITCDGDIGGAEMTLLRLLDAVDRSAVQPSVVAAEGTPLANALRARDVPIVASDQLGYVVRDTSGPCQMLANVQQLISSTSLMTAAARDGSIDLVHAWVTPAFKYAGAVARRLGIPAVATVHDVLGPPFPWYARRLIGLNLRLNFACAIVPSLVAREALVRTGVPRRRIKYIPNGVDLIEIREGAPRGVVWRERLGAGPEDFLLGAVGRLIPLKGHDVLLHALALLARRGLSLRCAIVGGSSSPREQRWADHLRSLADTLGLRTSVILTGFQEDVPGLLAALDLLVHPSVGADAFPGAVLEAMAAGRPVIASSIGGAPEILTDGVTGLIVPANSPEKLAESIALLARDRSRRTAMGEAAVTRVRERYSRAGQVQATLEVYSRLTSGRAGTSL